MRNYTRKNRIIQYPPNLINDYIEHVIYINLDSRHDRKQRLLKEISVFNPAKISRLSAVKNSKYPVIGCALSHIKALKYARKMGYANVLILEDDAVWSNVTEGYKVFKHLINNPYDVIMLGGTYPKFNRATYRVKFSYSAHAYIVHNSYYDTIIEAAENAIREYNPKVDGASTAAIDVTFSNLQKKDKWFLVYPALMVQGKSHSNIVGGVVNYRKAFILKRNNR